MTRAGKGLSGWGSTWFYILYMCIYILYVCSIYRSRTPVIQHCPRAAFFITLKWPLPHTASQGVTGSHLLLSSHLTRLLCQKGRKKGTKRGGTTKKHLGCMLNGGFLNGGTLKSSSDWGAPIYGSPRITKFKHMGFGPIRDANRGMEPASDTECGGYYGVNGTCKPINF